MGLVYAEIELINGSDVVLMRRNYIDKDEVRRMHLTVLVDTGASMLAINENIQSQLDLAVLGKCKTQLANSQIVECDTVGPVELRFKNRNITCMAIVLPGDSEPLLGTIPLEEMDVLIHPLRQELIVNPDHPNYPVLKL